MLMKITAYLKHIHVPTPDKIFDTDNFLKFFWASYCNKLHHTSHRDTSSIGDGGAAG